MELSGLKNKNEKPENPNPLGNESIGQEDYKRQQVSRLRAADWLGGPEKPE